MLLLRKCIFIQVSTFLQAFLTLCFALGIKKAIIRVVAHPALVLTPFFSFWTFGPVKLDSFCTYRRSETKICLSFRQTWLNAILSFCGTFGMVALHETFYAQNPWKINLSLILAKKGTDVEVLSWFLVAYLPLLAISIICLLLIQFMDKCSSCCCQSCKENCYPMTEKKVLDTEMVSP